MDQEILQLKELCNLQPSSDVAVIFHDGEKKDVLNYQTFCDLKIKLVTELQTIMPITDGKYIAIGVYSDLSLYLPVVIHALIDLHITFVPLMLDNNLITLIKRTSLQCIIVDSRILSRFLSQVKQEQIALSKIHHFGSLLVIVELELETDHVAYENISYVVQSSGSTGKPKVIFVPERCIVPNIVDLREIFSISSNDMLLIPSALTFDASIVQMLLAWSSGAAVVMVSAKLHFDTALLASALVNSGVSVLQCTPSFLHLIGMGLLEKTLFREDSKLRVLALGGERFPQKEAAKSWLANHNTLQLYNIYGTSEVSSWAAIHKVTEEDIDCDTKHADSDWLPIGTPLSRTCVEVRNEVGELVKDGGYGNILIGGKDRVCIVDGDDTADMYFPMRFTGDIGKIKNGKVHFCGRSDNKVKHNGQLIDLDVLCMVVENKCEFSCCVVEHSILTGRDELYLFIKPFPYDTSLMDVEVEILNIIKKELSYAYIPENVILVDYFEITSHGKIDKSKLKSHPSILQRQMSSKYTVSEFLLRSWNAALGLDINKEVDPDDNFISSGGESFSSIYFLNNITKYVNSRCRSVTNAGTLLDCISKGTFHELESLVDGVLNEEIKGDKNFLMKTDGITEVFQKAMTHSSEQVKCTHFVSYRKQAVRIDCSCFIDSVPSVPMFTIRKHHLSAPTLKKSWHCNLGKCVDSSPLIVINEEFKDGIVYIGSHSHYMLGIILSTGVVVWKTLLGDRIESSAIMCHGGKFIAVGCYDGYLYFLKSGTGDLHWKFYTGDTVKSSPVSDQNSGIVIVGSHGRKLYALDVWRQTCIWEFVCDSSCFSSPIINQQISCAYISLLSGKIYSLDVKSGNIQWENALTKPIFATPCLCKDFIVVACVDCYLYAINFDGVILWKFETLGPIFSSPVYLKCNLPHERSMFREELILFGSNDQLVYCLDINGKLVWKYKTSSSIYASVGVMRYDVTTENSSLKRWRGETNHKLQRKEITDSKRKSKSKLNMGCASDSNTTRKRKFGVISDKSVSNVCSVFVTAISTNGELHVLDVEKGSLLTSFTFPGEVYSSPVVVNNTIVVGCRDDNVYSLKIVWNPEEET